MKRYGRSGWFKESYRHYLAAKGITTSRTTDKYRNMYFAKRTQLDRMIRARAIEIMNEQNVPIQEATRLAKAEYANVERQVMRFQPKTPEEIEEQVRARLAKEYSNFDYPHKKELLELKQNGVPVEVMEQMSMEMFGKPLVADNEEDMITLDQFRELQYKILEEPKYQNVKDAMSLKRSITEQVAEQQAELERQTGMSVADIKARLKEVKADVALAKRAMADMDLTPEAKQQILRDEYGAELEEIEALQQSLERVVVKPTEEQKETLARLNDILRKQKEKIKGIKTDISVATKGYVEIDPRTGETVWQEALTTADVDEAMANKAARATRAQERQFQQDVAQIDDSIKQLRTQQKEAIKPLEDAEREYRKRELEARRKGDMADAQIWAGLAMDKAGEADKLNKEFGATINLLVTRKERNRLARGPKGTKEMPEEEEPKKELAKDVKAEFLKNLGVITEKVENKSPGRFDVKGALVEEQKPLDKMTIAEMDEYERNLQKQQLMEKFGTDRVDVAPKAPGMSPKRYAPEVSVGDATISQPGYKPKGIRKYEPKTKEERKAARRKTDAEKKPKFDPSELLDVGEEAFTLEKSKSVKKKQT